MKPIGWRYDSYRHALAARGLLTRKYSAYIRLTHDQKMEMEKIFSANPRLKLIRDKAVRNIVRKPAEWGFSFEPDTSDILTPDTDEKFAGGSNWGALKASLAHELTHAAQNERISGGLSPWIEMTDELARNSEDLREKPYMDAPVEEYRGVYYHSPFELDSQKEQLKILSELPDDQYVWGQKGVDVRNTLKSKVYAGVRTLPEFKAAQELFHEQVRRGPNLRAGEDKWVKENKGLVDNVLWSKGPWTVVEKVDPDTGERSHMFVSGDFKKRSPVVEYPTLNRNDDVGAYLAWDAPERIPGYVRDAALKLRLSKAKSVVLLPKTDLQLSEIAFKRMFAARKVQR